MTKVLFFRALAAIALSPRPKLSRPPTPLARRGRQPCMEPT